jgi:hypothetical protein
MILITSFDSSLRNIWNRRLLYSTFYWVCFKDIHFVRAQFKKVNLCLPSLLLCLLFFTRHRSVSEKLFSLLGNIHENNYSSIILIIDTVLIRAVYHLNPRIRWLFCLTSIHTRSLTLPYHDRTIKLPNDWTRVHVNVLRTYTWRASVCAVQIDLCLSNRLLASRYSSPTESSWKSQQLRTVCSKHECGRKYRFFLTSSSAIQESLSYLFRNILCSLCLPGRYMSGGFLLLVRPVWTIWSHSLRPVSSHVPRPHGPSRQAGHWRSHAAAFRPAAHVGLVRDPPIRSDGHGNEQWIISSNHDLVHKYESKSFSSAGHINQLIRACMRHVVKIRRIRWTTIGIAPNLACTVKASSFEPHENFGPLLAKSVASLLGELCNKMSTNEFANLRFSHNFHFIHSSV